MKTTVIILSAGLVVMGVVGGAILVGATRSNRDLRKANRKLEAELQVAQTLADTLRVEKAQTEVQLAGVQDSFRTLQTRTVEMESARDKEDDAATVPPVVTPYQAATYLGQTYLGQAWIIPRNLRMDTNAQRYVYEPVIALNESFRSSFVTNYTNIVEREVPMTYVNENYSSVVAVNDSSPVWNRGPKRFPRPPERPGPTQSVQAQPPPKFDPGNGTTTPQRLGTPAGAIKTRPQVPATPNNPAQ